MKYRFFENYFDIPALVCCAHIVDILDEEVILVFVLKLWLKWSKLNAIKIKNKTITYTVQWTVVSGVFCCTSSCVLLGMERINKYIYCKIHCGKPVFVIFIKELIQKKNKTSLKCNICQKTNCIDMSISKNFCFIETSNIEIIKLTKIDVNKTWHVLFTFTLICTEWWTFEKVWFLERC